MSQCVQGPNAPHQDNGRYTLNGGGDLMGEKAQE